MVMAAAAAQETLAAATNRLEPEQRAAAEVAKSHADRLVGQQQQAVAILDKDLALRMALTQTEQVERATTDATTRNMLADRAYNQTLADLVFQTEAIAPAALRTLLVGLDVTSPAALGARFEVDQFGNAVLVLPGDRRVVVSRAELPAPRSTPSTPPSRQSHPANRSPSASTKSWASPRTSQPRLRAPTPTGQRPQGGSRSSPGME